jgi:hypothetical protein
MCSLDEGPAASLMGVALVETTLADLRVVLHAGSRSSCLPGHYHPEVVGATEQRARTAPASVGMGYAPTKQLTGNPLRLAFRDEAWTDSVVWLVSPDGASDFGLLGPRLAHRRRLGACGKRRLTRSRRRRLESEQLEEHADSAAKPPSLERTEAFGDA